MKPKPCFHLVLVIHPKRVAWSGSSALGSGSEPHTGEVLSMMQAHGRIIQSRKGIAETAGAGFSVETIMGDLP